MSDRGSHWLWRLDAPQWLAASFHEWRQAQANLDRRRSCVTHLRRAAGMSLNAVLVYGAEQGSLREGADPETQWGRSYMDHLRLAAEDCHPLRPGMAKAIARIRDLSLHSPTPALVALRTGPPMLLMRAVHDTQELLDACAEYIGPSRR